MPGLESLLGCGSELCQAPLLESRADQHCFFTTKGRDPKTHQAHWVTPAPSYEVESDEAQELKQYQGYDQQTTGQDYEGEPDKSGDAA